MITNMSNIFDHDDFYEFLSFKGRIQYSIQFRFGEYNNLDRDSFYRNRAPTPKGFSGCSTLSKAKSSISKN